MAFQKIILVLALSAGLLDVAFGESHGRISARSNLFPRQNNDTPSTCLAQKAIQTGSFSDGQGQGETGVKPGQAPSETSQNNFIDACDGQTLTNGEQNLQGSCNPIPMGEIPSFDNMVSAIITSPKNVEDVEANKDFDITLQVNNLIAGAFTNPDITYYTAPQRLNGGKIIGHVHVTVQDIGQANPGQPPDAREPKFFKGIDDAGDNNGGLKATVVGGLPAGFYRICTMVAARNHQPVTMPKAKRGAQDDCIRITVGQGNGANQDAGGNQDGGQQQDANGDQNAGGDQNGGNQNAGDQNGDNQNAGDQNGGNQNAGDQNGGNQNTGDQNGGDQNTGGQQNTGGDQNGGGDQNAGGQQDAGSDQNDGGQQGGATSTSAAGFAQPTGSTGQQDSAGVNARGNTRGYRGHHRHRGSRGNRRKNFQRDEASTLESRGPVPAQEQPKIISRSYDLI